MNFKLPRIRKDSGELGFFVLVEARVPPCRGVVCGISTSTPIAFGWKLFSRDRGPEGKREYFCVRRKNILQTAEVFRPLKTSPSLATPRSHPLLCEAEALR